MAHGSWLMAHGSWHTARASIWLPKAYTQGVFLVTTTNMLIAFSALTHIHKFQLFHEKASKVSEGAIPWMEWVRVNKQSEQRGPLKDMIVETGP